ANFKGYYDPKLWVRESYGRAVTQRRGGVLTRIINLCKKYFSIKTPGNREAEFTREMVKELLAVTGKREDSHSFRRTDKTCGIHAFMKYAMIGLTENKVKNRDDICRGVRSAIEAVLPKRVVSRSSEHPGWSDPARKYNNLAEMKEDW